MSEIIKPGTPPHETGGHTGSDGHDGRDGHDGHDGHDGLSGVMGQQDDDDVGSSGYQTPGLGSELPPLHEHEQQHFVDDITLQNYLVIKPTAAQSESKTATSTETAFNCKVYCIPG